MVAYNFKPQFASLVVAGTKLQTIRAERRSRHARPGEAVQLYTGMRTKGCQKLLTPDPICQSVEPLLIHYELGIKMDDRWLTRDECTQIAIADGFDDWAECFRFFKNVHGLPFKGVLIKWEALSDAT
jgi:hypothetical protein